MDIAVIGTGYVGLCSGVGLAAKGNRIVCVGRKREKIDSINRGVPPIYEDGLHDMLQRLVSEKRLSATGDLEKALEQAEATFICVGTPCDDRGRIDLTEMETVAKQLGGILKKMNRYHTVVVKSTVVPGTTEKVIKILEETSGKKAGSDFGVGMNPEFLREGKALEDFLKPDRIVIGEYDERSGSVLEGLYKNFNAPILRTNLRTAEMIKYASNSLLATKISFSNEIGNICKQLGIDTYEVMKGVGLDNRIGHKFLDAGLGFGGSCFPKDVSALKSLAEDIGADNTLLTDILDVNKKQRFKIIELLERKIGDVKGKNIAILGLAFKDGTDDIREAPSLDIIRVLLERGASVRAYDPEATENVKKIYPNVIYKNDPAAAIEGADACLILTEWDEFRKLEDKDFALMKQRVIIEGRKVLDKNNVRDFEGVCW